MFLNSIVHKFPIINPRPYPNRMCCFVGVDQDLYYLIKSFALTQHIINCLGMDSMVAHATFTKTHFVRISRDGLDARSELKWCITPWCLILFKCPCSSSSNPKIKRIHVRHINSLIISVMEYSTTEKKIELW